MELELVWLLRAAWIAGTLPILVASIPSSRLSSVHGLLLDFAKRGKIMSSSSKRFTLPQKYFGHFYAVASVWTTFLLVATWMYAYKTVPIVSKPFHYSTFASQIAGGSQIFSWLQSHTAPVEYKYSVWRSVFLLLLMDVQVLRRLYETIYVFNYSSSARMHILGYLTGFFRYLGASFYTAGPLSLCCNCIPEVYKFVLNGVAEFIVIGKNRMPAFELDWWEFVIPLVKLGWLQWIGAAIFFWGWIHQLRCHAILGSLRENKAQADEYVIPHGDWFKIVSSPHYLAEIVIAHPLSFMFLIVVNSSNLHAFVTVLLSFAFSDENEGGEFSVCSSGNP
ncbi:hypothetical protein F8388_024063 [Cannabis sativa]|uniref:3-oxo-5-alpha-steroid 4-dehydrogenase C-terminal domain-containing protein n=1 Tax=Cannabis sativa TaxID=3483 RepID=A0A7J6FXD8_CANSA|nr:hypothetical protein G4B88_021959 [Cannabis sativa]KAF4375404.1 hypothetical protein F8388_024063 [Cannabis sativa]